MKKFILFAASLGIWMLFNACASFMASGPNDWGNVDADSIAVAVQGMDTSAAARVLFDIGEREFIKHPFVMTEDRHVRIQILKESGKEYANIRIPFYKDEVVTGIKAQTILPNGDVIKLKGRDIYEEGEKDGWRYKVFSIPGVQKNCIIEYKYGKETKYLSVIDPWIFQREIETVLSRITVIVPPGFNYMSFLKNMPEERYTMTNTTQINPDGYKEGKYTWEARNLPPIKEEPYMTTTNDYLGRLHFQLKFYRDPYNFFEFIDTWTDVSDKLRKNYKPYLDGDREVTRLAARVTQGEKSRDRKIQMVYEYVRDSIETGDYEGIGGYYFKTPAQIIESKTASAPEKNLMVVAMLQALDIPANPLAISTRSHGRLNQQIARLAEFNHILAYSKGYQGEYFLDTDDSYCPFGMFPPEDNAGNGLLLEDGSSRFVKIPEPKSVSMKYAFIDSATIDSAGTLHFSANLRFEGYRNFYYRRYLDRADDDADFIDRWIVDDIQDVEVDTFFLQNRETVDAPLTITLECKVPEFAMIAGDNMYFATALFHPISKNIFQYENRTYPVEYNYPRINQETVEINLPQNYTVAELPKTQVLSIRGHQYKRQIVEQDGKLTCSRVLLIDKTYFMPREYQEIRDFYSQIVQNDQSQIVLTKQ